MRPRAPYVRLANMRTRSRLLLLAALPLLLLAACSDAPTASPAATAPVTGTASPPSPGGTATATPSPVATPAAAKSLGAPSGVPHTAADPSFTALPGAKAYFGKLGAAAYRIEIPEAWNGDLVLWAHGFRGFGTELTVESPRMALRQLLLKQGYAWAASSYSENGYVPGIGADDTLALKQHFARQFGAPKRTYITGASMGGNVVALSLEHFGGEYDGGLAVCGALGGEEIIDYLISWAMVAEFVADVTLPLGKGQALVTAAVVTGIAPALGPAEAPTEKGRAFANIIMHLTGGPRPFFSEGFREQYMINFGLVISDPDRTSLTGRAATNEGHVYHIDPGYGFTDAQLNSGVRSLPADPRIRNASAYPDKAPTTGRISDPLLTLHNTGDLFVPITQEQSYRRKAEAAGRGNLLVQRIIRDGGHCEFSEQEVSRAWNDLTAWVTTGTKPAGDDVLADLSDAGRAFTDPIRPDDPGNR